MEIETYSEEKHFNELKTWWWHWGVDMVPEALPKKGFVVEGLAAGFLYQTDSKIALIESLITKPGSDKKVRSTALDLIVARILKEAWDLGFEAVTGFSQVSAIAERSLAHGFQVTPKPYYRMIRGMN